MEIIATYSVWKKELDTELKNQEKSFVRTGYLLKVARDTDILSESGYKTVAEFAKAEYGLSKDVVSRYIAINDRYSVGGYSEFLQEKYRPYGIAKLQEMLTLPDEVIEVIPAGASRSEIQDIKREIKEEERVSDIELLLEKQNPEGAEAETNLEKMLHEYFHEHYREYRNIHKAFDTEEEKIEGVLNAIAPSGIGILMARVRGLGKFMLSIQGKDNPLTLLNVRSNEKELYEWGAAVRILESFYKTPGKASKDWESRYQEEWPEKAVKVAQVQPKKDKKPGPENLEAEKGEKPEPEGFEQEDEAEKPEQGIEEEDPALESKAEEAKKENQAEEPREENRAEEPQKVKQAEEPQEENGQHGPRDEAAEQPDNAKADAEEAIKEETAKQDIELQATENDEGKEQISDESYQEQVEMQEDGRSGREREPDEEHHPEELRNEGRRIAEEVAEWMKGGDMDLAPEIERKILRLEGIVEELLKRSWKGEPGSGR